jgi:hypothetical protein
MNKRSFLVAVLCAAVFAAGSVSAALAGEVKGPPGDGTTQAGGNPNATAAPAHANSICAFNGLNDYDSLEGQNDFHVQSYGIDVAGKGDPADPHVFNPGVACNGHSGFFAGP